MLKTIGDAVAAYVLPRILDALQAQVEKQLPVVMEKVLAMLPLLAASAAKAATDPLLEVLRNMPDIDIPGVSDVFDLTETVRAAANGSMPDIDIPILSDIFDLADLLNRRR